MSDTPLSYDELSSYDSSAAYDNPSFIPGVDSLTQATVNALNYSDIAVPTSLTAQAGVGDQVLHVVSTANYPPTPFVVALEAGSATQEVCLVQDVSPTALLGVTRSFDGNGAFPHPVFSSVVHSTTAGDYQNINSHIFSSTVDWHPQYLDQFRHINPSLHQEGVSLPFGMPSYSFPGDVAAEGLSPYTSPADHVHGRETLGEILFNGFASNSVVMINSVRTDTFFWLQTSQSGEKAPNPFPGWSLINAFLPFTTYTSGSSPTTLGGHVWNYDLILDAHVTPVRR